MTKNNVLYENNKILKYDKFRTGKDLNGVNVGFMILTKNLVKLLENKSQDFETIIFPKMIKDNEISCYLTDHKYYV